MSHKKRGGINILLSTPQEFKLFRNSEYNPMQEIVRWGLVLSKNEGLSNWNKMVKPSACDFKSFQEANNWVEHKEGFMITMEAQNFSREVGRSQCLQRNGPWLC